MVSNGFHTNSIEDFWSILKRGIFGIYHYVSAKHLTRYCDEFSYRYNTKEYNDMYIFAFTLTKLNGMLKCNQLIGKE